MAQVNYFNIADYPIQIVFEESPYNDMRLLPSFEPFRTAAPGEGSDTRAGHDGTGQPLFRLVVDDTLRPIAKERRKRIRTFDTGNGDTIVDKVDDGGYQYIIKDLKGAECCMLQTDKEFSHCRCALNGSYDMRCFGLNNALMLIFAFASSLHHTLLIHASLVRQNGRGYAFIAKSGTGKSTQVSLWLRYLPGCDLMNDDNPVVRVVDGLPYIYGSPWSGKTPCYRNVKARLGAITRIDRAPQNSIERLSPVEAFASLLPSCSSMKWDEDIYNRICDTVSLIVESTGIYTLHCLPDREAAELCKATIAQHQDPQG